MSWEDLHSGGRSDLYGECVLLGMGISPPDEYSWFANIATSPHLNSCAPLMRRLDTYFTDNPLPSVHKIRYWNGLAVISRPVLALVGVDGLRILGMSFLLGALAVLVHVISCARGRLAALALLGPVFLTGDILGIMQVFHHSMMLGAGFLGIAYLAHRANHSLHWDKLTVPAFVVGSCYSFVNLMNFVPGLWVMSIAVVSGCSPPSQNLAERTRRMTVSASGQFAAGLRRNLHFWDSQPFSRIIIVLSI